MKFQLPEEKTMGHILHLNYWYNRPIVTYVVSSYSSAYAKM